MRTFRRGTAGFTLIELMLVISIVGILAAVASPLYLDYMIRGQIADGLGITSGAKTAVAEYYQEHGVFPADNIEAALEAPVKIRGNYVVSVSVAGPVISVTYGNKANTLIAGETVVLTADDATGSLTWACASGGVIEDKHLPRACQ